MESSRAASFQQHFYPRSPCGERLHLYASSGVDFAISIHALLAESDGSAKQAAYFFFISIHALLAESDQAADGFPDAPPHISIHALLAESDHNAKISIQFALISIHALLAESDSKSAQNSGALLRI